MNSRMLVRKTLASFLAVAVLSLYAMAAPASAAVSGELSVSGNVSVNGQAATSGATVFSDSTYTTGENSSAVISLGKLGRVEIAPNTTLTLNFNNNALNAQLTSGQVRVSAAEGTAATVNTNDGAVSAKDGVNVFSVSAAKNTRVMTQAGSVEARSADKTMTVTAGNSATLGMPQDKDDDNGRFGPLSGGALAALLLAAGGAIAAIIIATRNNNDLNFGGSAINVVSPTR